MDESVDIIIREPVPADGPEMGATHVLAWQIGYPGIIPDAHLDGLDAEDRGRFWTEVMERRDAMIRDTGTRSPDDPYQLVAEVDGRVVGFAVHGPYRSGPDEDPEDEHRLCQLWAINVHPDHWGTGAAQALMDRVIDGLRSTRSEPAAALWVLEGNGRGRRFYEKVGWAADGATKTDEFAGTTVTEVRYVRDL